ncbi:HET-domain-containing protein, partial [Paraphaeosphaeria sporulosa]
MVSIGKDSTESCLIYQAFYVAEESTNIKCRSEVRLTGLCERCQSDDLEGFLLGKYECPETPESELYYETGSLRSDCICCVQIASLVNKSTVGYTENGSPKRPNAYFIGRRGLKNRSLSIRIPGHSVHEWWTGEVHSSPIHPLPHRSSRSTEVVGIETIRYKRIKRWVKDCETYHRHTCWHSYPEWKVSTITVIDCNSKSLIDIRSDQRYIALSYIWGSNTHEALHYQRDLPDRLPRTIADAIQVALNLKIFYLWIDKYCIDQHDYEGKERLIRHMDRIYTDAFLTIVASAGDGPHHGLPGVSLTPRSPVDRTILGQCTLVNPYETRAHIEKSLWNARGWTYQEAMLSCRRLVFTQSQTYFQCQLVASLESVTLASRDLFIGKVFSNISKNSFEVYSCIEHFWHRQLSFDSDRLNAIQGIFTALEGVE